MRFSTVERLLETSGLRASLLWKAQGLPPHPRAPPHLRSCCCRNPRRFPHPLQLHGAQRNGPKSPRQRRPLLQVQQQVPLTGDHRSVPEAPRRRRRRPLRRAPSSPRQRRRHQHHQRPLAQSSATGDCRAPRASDDGRKARSSHRLPQHDKVQGYGLADPEPYNPQQSRGNLGRAQSVSALSGTARSTLENSISSPAWPTWCGLQAVNQL